MWNPQSIASYVTQSPLSPVRLPHRVRALPPICQPGLPLGQSRARSSRTQRFHQIHRTVSLMVFYLCACSIPLQLMPVLKITLVYLSLSLSHRICKTNKWTKTSIYSDFAFFALKSFTVWLHAGLEEVIDVTVTKAVMAKTRPDDASVRDSKLCCTQLIVLSEIMKFRNIELTALVSPFFPKSPR